MGSHQDSNEGTTGDETSGELVGEPEGDSCPVILYSHSVGGAAIFPMVDPGDTTAVYRKTQYSWTYGLTRGLDVVDGNVSHYPFGKYARLLTALFSKWVHMADGHKTRKVDPATKTIYIQSIAQLCHELGVSDRGPTPLRVREQLRNLMSCNLTRRREIRFGTGRAAHQQNFNMVREGFFVDRSNPDTPDEYRELAAVIRVTDEFWDFLEHETAPFNVNIAKQLLKGRQVMAFDIYIWLISTLHTLRFQLPRDWDWLYERFGTDIKDKYHFRDLFKASLDKALAVFPQARVDVVARQGIVLHPLAPGVAARLGRQVQEDLEREQPSRAVSGQGYAHDEARIKRILEQTGILDEFPDGEAEARMALAALDSLDVPESRAIGQLPDILRRSRGHE